MALLSFPGIAAAQDFNLAPSAGEVTLNNGFEPDPHEVTLTVGGGKIDASTGPSACVGYIRNPPDFRLQYTAGDYPLIFSAESATDTTLIVNNPNGEWLCNDDSTDINPVVTIDSPLSGQYDVWVGSFSRSTIADATLRISEIGTGGDGGILDAGLDPTYGTDDLTSGFEPDPYEVEMASVGGAVAASTADPNVSCYGNVSSAPDFRLNYTAGSYPLFFTTEGDDDLTLVINDPSGAWHCDDDSGFDTNPLLRFDNPESGQYDIWVGTYSSGSNPPATLIVTELQPVDPSLDLPDTSLPARVGTIDLASGFAPDPHTASLTAGGGSIDASNLSDGDGSCAGLVNAAPDFSLNYSGAGNAPLTFTVKSSGDTTLLINDANGGWFCDDDSAGNLNPRVTFATPVDGRYDIWVGTFSSTAEATLEITGRTGK